MLGGCCTRRREHEDGPRYVAKGARIDRLVLSAPLPPSVCPTVHTYQQYGHTVAILLQATHPFAHPSYSRLSFSCLSHSISDFLFSFLTLSLYVRLLFFLSLSLSPPFFCPLLFHALFFVLIHLFFYLVLLYPFLSSFLISPPFDALSFSVDLICSLAFIFQLVSCVSFFILLSTCSLFQLQHSCLFIVCVRSCLAFYI